MSVNPVEVDSDEDDNAEGDTNNQTQAGSETPEDSGVSVETSTEPGVDEKTNESLKGKREKLQLQAGHGVPETGRKRSNQGNLSGDILVNLRSEIGWKCSEALTYAKKNVVYLFF